MPLLAFLPLRQNLTKPLSTAGTRTLLLALAAALGGAALSGCQKTAPEEIFLQTLNNQVIEPNYHQLVESSQAVESATASCSEESMAEFLPAAQSSWREAMMAWQRAKVIGFGPMTEQRLDWEFQFWPDKKNLVAKKAKTLLKKETPLTAEELNHSSVVLHGLSALEYLLFDPTAQTGFATGRYCELTRWIGQQMVVSSKALDSSWALVKPEFVAPNAESENFESATQAIGMVLDDYLLSLQSISKDKILGALGETGTANPYFLESWRAQHSWQNIEANISAVNQLFQQGGFIAYLESLGLHELAGQLQQRLAALNEAAGKIEPPLFSSLDQQAEPLKQVAATAKALRLLLQQDTTQVLKLPIGFNDSDGD
ncbi:imelysin family protein [Halioxenophilus sp. WMMB6]|uniref:imelysin family protein n=1 Tax=Halioxenophilus sp. WMMB6 TaxID=3073815 RepID=UPI00295F06B4|nr:imelysin family protein [Halioxenophilus sp. WMMB6]